MIRVTLAPHTDADPGMSAHTSYTVLVDNNAATNSSLMLVSDDDNMATTDRLLEELTNTSLTSNQLSSNPH